MDFQFYDYSEPNFANERSEMKNSWTIPSDGSMESNEEYFNWSPELKLTLSTSVNQKNDRKRKYFSAGSEVLRKVQIVDAIKNSLELSSGNPILEKDITDKRDLQNGSKLPSWQVDEITENLTAELNGTLTNLSAEFGNNAYNVSEALLALPSLTVFKQEAPSPKSIDTPQNKLNSTSSIPQVNQSEYPDTNNNQNSLSTTLQNLLSNEYAIENVGDSPTNSQDSSRGLVTSSDYLEDNRFQYVLAAATSIATKVNEDTLTYLNQGQSYEIKLKKLGDLSNFRGKILKSVIRICFYERRLQYMEKEQMSLWQSSRPGDRIIEVDVPLSYGLCDVIQPPNEMNAVNFLWDPTKEVGVYIKVNCISTEFTPKKHGGEKGVPFRIQVETYLNGDANSAPKRLHAAACQIKVFKLKGADRKHKQDRDKIMKRPITEQEKYQPSYECTILNDIPDEAVISSPLTINGVSSIISGPYSPEIVSPHSNDLTPKTDETCAPPNLPPLGKCLSDSNLLISQQLEQTCQQVTSEFTTQQIAQWLTGNRFGNYLQTFSGFSGADMLRMSKEDFMQICGQADGIRLFNTLHSKIIAPKLILYICRENSTIFHALYLSSHKTIELQRKLSDLLCLNSEEIQHIFCQGPHGIHIHVTDDVIRHVQSEAMFVANIVRESNNGVVIVLKPIVK